MHDQAHTQGILCKARNMANAIAKILDDIRSAASSSEDRTVRARRLAGLIKQLGEYRWVGIYDVGPEFVRILGWSGSGAPAYPSFSVAQGLTGAAIQKK